MNCFAIGNQINFFISNISLFRIEISLDIMFNVKFCFTIIAANFLANNSFSASVPVITFRVEMNNDFPFSASAYSTHLMVKSFPTHNITPQSP